MSSRSHADVPADPGSFYRPGLWVLDRLERLGISWLDSGSLTVAAFLVPGFAAIWLESSEDDWKPILAMIAAVFFAGFVNYLNASASNGARSREWRLWRAVGVLNKNAAGQLSVLIENFSRRHRSSWFDEPRMNKSAYRTEIEALQQHLLAHVVRLVCHESSRDPEAIGMSACWCTPRMLAGVRAIQPVRFDRNKPGQRFPDGKWAKPGQEHLGVRRPFEDQKTVFVQEVPSAELQDEAEPEAEPKNVLGIPVVMGPLTVGVVVVSCEVTGVLMLEHEQLLLDTAYLIGFCEVLRQEGNVA